MSKEPEPWRPDRWTSMSPTEVLDAFPALTVSMVAHVVPLCWTRKADPSQVRPARRKAIELIRSGALQLVDSAAPIHRWVVTSDEVRRYLKFGSRVNQADGSK